MTKAVLARILLVFCFLGHAHAEEASPPIENGPALLAPENLVAWCIVPFDAAKRGPAERAEMLERLGIRRSAYDWRAEHVDSFEEEIREYQKRGFDFFAFWDQHPEAFQLFKKHGLAPQIWKTAPSSEGSDEENRVAASVEQLMPLVELTRDLDFPLGLYNHGGWGGDPKNLVAVCERLRSDPRNAHVGIVYNFHHAHEHLETFKTDLALMLPYLLCVNLNGMNADAEPKILTIGKGQNEKAMIRVLVGSGYQGRIGILDHRDETDSEETLRENLEGLARIREELKAIKVD